ncbi:HD-GYP domain-containing protein [Cohnella soli]|uniref:HD-GYP domain-containing protein n=1 Tax=Cohnella soli TaxID=425005 RepID=A0ABW0I2N8_9BACL
MGKEHSTRYRYVGKRLVRNMYSPLGTLLVPIHTVLSPKEIDTLFRQGVLLHDEDVEDVAILHLVDAAISEIRDIFQSARHSDRISFEAIRERILPVVLLMSLHPDISRILAHLEKHDEYLYRHSIGVALLSKMIGSASGYQGDELTELITSAFLHDIGKSRIPLDILNKPGALTAEEFECVKKHTIYGYELIRQSPGLDENHALVALQHHEREDGSGYPYGLKGDATLRNSKIVAVADVFHAMISKRVYKSSVSFYQVLQEMSRNAFGALEPEITLNFMKRIMDLLIGNTVLLSNGSEAKIVMVSPHDPVNPLVEANGMYIDLSKEKQIVLERILSTG